VKIGAKIVRHGRSFTFRMAEVMVPRTLFRQIRDAIAALRPLPPARCCVPPQSLAGQTVGRVTAFIHHPTQPNRRSDSHHRTARLAVDAFPTFLPLKKPAGDEYPTSRRLIGCASGECRVNISAAKARAMAAPMLRAAPVITAVLPARRGIPDGPSDAVFIYRNPFRISSLATRSVELIIAGRAVDRPPGRLNGPLRRIDRILHVVAQLIDLVASLLSRASLFTARDVEQQCQRGRRNEPVPHKLSCPR
jgi:hypothetical protein